MGFLQRKNSNMLILLFQSDTNIEVFSWMDKPLHDLNGDLTEKIF